MHLLITRPEPDASEWRRLLEARGAQATVDPLLAIELQPPLAINAGRYQAVVITSRNALRALEASPQATAALKGKPLFAVGGGTAAHARALGFTDIREGAATARHLVDPIRSACSPAGGPLLHLAGDKLAFDLAAALAGHSLALDRLTVYRSRPADALRPETVAGLSSGIIDAVMVMSPLTAKTFAQLAAQAKVTEQCQRLVYVCLSENVAYALSPLSPRTVHVANEPNAPAMFTLIESLLA